MLEGQPIGSQSHTRQEQKIYPIDYKKIDGKVFNPDREIVGSRAFNLEYSSYTTKQEMYDDMVSYLGEYRFQLKKFDYEMVYTKGQDGIWAIRDTVRGESLGTKAQRVLDERKYRGDSITREIHEAIGIRKLDEQLRLAETGDKILWESPPGEAREGYGEYGFLYKGDVRKKEDGSLELHMSAIRLEGELESYNQTLAELTGVLSSHRNSEEFLSDPRLVRGDTARINLPIVLAKHFGFTPDTGQDQDFKEAIRRVEPLIHEVIEKIKTGSQYEKVTAFNTLENYFLKQKRNIQEEKEAEGKVMYTDSYRQPTLGALKGLYGYDAPIARGSCGSTGKSSNLAISGGQQLDNFLKASGVNTGEDEYSFDEMGNCRVCGKEEVSVGPCQICQPCDSKIKVEQQMNPFKDAA